MKRYIMKSSLMLAFIAGGLSAQAQVQLPDLNEQEVDLGFGIRHSELLSTASTMTITSEELQQTSAISLAEALYGKLLGLTAVSNGGFAGDESFGATFNIRGIQTYDDDTSNLLNDKNKIEFHISIAADEDLLESLKERYTILIS